MFEDYLVKNNEQLSDISSKFGISENDLSKINDLITSKLFDGQLLRIPKKNLGYINYIVKKGDTMYSISNSYGVDIDVLTKINGLDNNEYLYENQELLIPNEYTNVYITNNDDTIDIVSKRTNVKKIDLVNDNNIYLLEGQAILYKK